MADDDIDLPSNLFEPLLGYLAGLVRMDPQGREFIGQPVPEQMPSIPGSSLLVPKSGYVSDADLAAISGADALNIGAGVAPGIGDLLSGYDAYYLAKQAGNEAAQGEWMDALGSLGLGGLAGLGALPVIPALHTVFHGSPHRWVPEEGFKAGRFKLDKMGSGEGAQAYGAGAYFAENKGVANDYRSALSNNQPSTRIYVNDIPLIKYFGDNNIVASDVGFALEHAGMDVDKAINEVGSESIQSQLKKLRGKNITAQIPGHTYTLDLPDEVLPKLLDWDKPLDKQSEQIRDALSQLLHDEYNLNEYDIETVMGGYKATPELQEIRETLRAPANAEEAWRFESRGIPGLSYLDGSSRKAGEGSRNFVIWDQDVLNRTVPLAINDVPTGLKPGDYDDINIPIK